jgi:hypothetical protein
MKPKPDEEESSSSIQTREAIKSTQRLLGIPKEIL